MHRHQVRRAWRHHTERPGNLRRSSDNGATASGQVGADTDGVSGSGDPPVS